MKLILLLLGFVWLTSESQAQQKLYCTLQGAVCAIPTKQGADFWIYEDDSEAFADMLVYEEENKLYADQPGIWYFVENKGLSDFTVFFTKEKSEADFVIFFTDTNTFAGCQ